MSNDNSGLRNLQKELNELNQLVRTKDGIVESSSELSNIENTNKYLSPVDIDNEEFSGLVEKVAVMQFEGNKRQDIMLSLGLSSKEFKEIILSAEFEDIKQKLVQDNKTYLLAKILGKFDDAINTLSDLLVTADEDKVRMQSAALLIENAKELLNEAMVDKNASTISQVAKAAASGGDETTIRLAEFVIGKRKERGLPSS
jgi:hypothetical protein